MALINGRNLHKKIKVEISADVLMQIEQYCSWANIEHIDSFIEQAADFIFKKDKEWKQHQKSTKKRSKIPNATVIF